MRSYIFNSETGLYQRNIPKGPWLPSLVMVVVLVLAALTAWEIHWRNQGYRPDIDNTKNLWAEWRTKADKAGPDETIITGSSRALFDIDLATWEEVTGSYPYQLAQYGASPLPVVRDLVDHTDFSGTLLVSVAPDIFFSKGSLTHGWPTSLVKHYEKWSPAQKMEHRLALFTEPYFAFIDEGDLTLGNLLRDLPVADRPDALLRSDRVPKISMDNYRREAKMWEKVEKDSAKYNKIRRIWLGFSSRPERRMTTADYHRQRAATFRGEFMEMPEDEKVTPAQLDTFFLEIKTLVDTFQARGGTLIFLRPPSSGMLRTLEAHYYPRYKYWDRLLEETGAPGIHFEDHPELQGFECPEWSHLRATDTEPFTAGLGRIVKRVVGSE